MAAVIFKLKLDALMKLIRSRKILGEIKGFVWRVEYQKRGLPHPHILFWSDFDTNDLAEVDKVLNVQFPRESPFPEGQETFRSFQILIRNYQLHIHSSRCRSASSGCKFGYPQSPSKETMIRGHTFILRRNQEEANVVPHNPTILAAFRCHHCFEVVHSEQCIGYVLKYCAKNRDVGEVGIHEIRYEGKVVKREQRLEYFAANRISSASECFASIAGYWRHHMSPAVISFSIHLEGKKVMLVGDQKDQERSWRLLAAWNVILAGRVDPNLII
jgi:hypothetical protein